MQLRASLLPRHSRMCVRQGSVTASHLPWRHCRWSFSAIRTLSLGGADPAAAAAAEAGGRERPSEGEGRRGYNRRLSEGLLAVEHSL
jgi:hypothetical protein